MDDSNPNDKRVDSLAAELERHGARECSLAIVLGSGLGSLADELEDPLVLQAARLKDLPGSRVAGHRGRLLLGTLAGVRVLLQQGRVHLYEGWSVAEVTRAVRAFARLGIRGLILTNAAGCLESSWQPGGFMRITDHIGLQGVAPLAGLGAARGAAYCELLGAHVDQAARELGVDLKRGIYAGLPGPSYETPAEIRMLRGLGAQAVGMSTVAEASAACAAGMQVVGMSCLTNYAAGLEAEPLDHLDVVRMGAAASSEFESMLRASLPAMAASLGSNT